MKSEPITLATGCDFASICQIAPEALATTAQEEDIFNIPPLQTLETHFGPDFQHPFESYSKR